jgi:hypothetical protein
MRDLSDPLVSPFRNLYETVTFSDSTAISGDISTFAKAMSYNSDIDTTGALPFPAD